MNRLGVSAVVITLNEECNIERCLESLRFADEIVVVDSCSTDRTVELARRYTDRVSTREFTGFSDQWNAAIDETREEWVLIVGADEVVSDKLAVEIEEAMAGDCDGYRMPRRTWFLDRPIRYCGWYPDYQLRLARKSRARMPDRLVHETLEVDGRIGTLKHDLVHFSYPTLDDYTRKMVHYSRAAAEQKLRDGRRFRITDILFTPWLTFLRVYVAQLGFRDGLHGLMLSVLAGCSTALRYAMLWEMSRRGGADE